MKKISKKVIVLFVVVAMTLTMTVVSYASPLESCVIITVDKGGYVSNFDIKYTGPLTFGAVIKIWNIQNTYIPDGEIMKIPIKDAFGDLWDDMMHDLLLKHGGRFIFEGGENINYSWKLDYAEVGDVPFVPSGPQFPAGYDFKEDSYRFANYGDTISKKYFTTLYGTDNGKLLYKNQKKQGGLCFGFSYTTAALNNGLPDCSIISTFDKGLFNYKFCDNIRDIWNLSVDFIDLTTHSTKIVSSAFIVGDNTITIEDYIKYAHIYQCSENVDKGSVWTDGNTILALVREYTNNDRIGVTIGMTRRDGKGGHRVLAVGYDENDILVDDPNYKDEYKRIHVNSDGSWSFNGLTGYNSNTCDIRYNLDFHVPYQLLLTGQTTTVAEKWIDDQYNVSEHYIEGMDILNKDCCLVAINAEDYTVENENLTKIITEEIESAENDESSDLYWLPKDKTITVSDFSGENNLIEFSGNGKILSLETNADGSVTFDTEDTEINVQTKENEDYYLQIEECYQDEEFNDLSDIVIISGTANGDEVTATETEDGIQVTGLNDITVTYETADSTAETTAKVDDGSTVNITVNDDENTVETDWQCKHPDENHDGICDTCSEDFTKSCSCSCHSNAFMQFIHKILCFLYRIFGMEQYRYCGCGKAHW